MSVWGRLPPGESSSCQRPSLSSQEMLVASPGTTCSLAARSAARWASSWEGKVSEKTSPRVFRTKAISLDVVLASACLPRLHHAVNIHGEPHWDGGYAANPPIVPLVGASRASDVLVVHLIPTDHAGLPVTKSEIDKRLGQITFNGPLQKDL